MRKVELSDGQSVEVRPLYRKEVKELREHGFKATYYDPPKDSEKADEGFVRAIEIQFAEEITDEWQNPDTKKVFLAIIGETYGLKEEEKN